jgi:hypothetical protein
MIMTAPSYVPKYRIPPNRPVSPSANQPQSMSTSISTTPHTLHRARARQVDRECSDIPTGRGAQFRSFTVQYTSPVSDEDQVKTPLRYRSRPSTTYTLRPTRDQGIPTISLRKFVCHVLLSATKDWPVSQPRKIIDGAAFEQCKVSP